uniref:H/ACA snoRNP protein NHP2 n=2 Tax=Nyssomyia neivai TaxID=330878 RepID=A0A1L8DH80_9DIPT
MGKVKKEPEVPENPEDVVIKKEDTETYEEKVLNVTAIAKPMASKKLAKKCFKLIKKASKQKTYLRNGLKDVQKRIRKGETGLVVFAGDVQPIDMICHLPAVCEEKGIPYVYVPSKSDLGNALGVKRASVSVLIREHADYKDLYDECSTEMIHLPVPS